MEKFKKELAKCIKVINSCKTIEQYCSAENYRHLFIDKYLKLGYNLDDLDNETYNLIECSLSKLAEIRTKG